MSDSASVLAAKLLRWPRRPSAWSLLALVIALPVVAPIVAILLTFFAPTTEIWLHLRQTVLLGYVLNTAGLLLVVAAVASLLGVVCAWLTATREFPGRWFFTWSLILPLAAPAYVVAYAYADLLAFGGFLHDALEALGWQNPPLPQLRSLVGAALVLSFTLYPYVYLLTFTAFKSQAGPLAEAAHSLGVGRTKFFFKVALPHARPAIAGGLALVLMETVADFGVVDFFGIPTLTYGVFRTWYAMGEPQAAMQLAGWLFLVVVVLVSFERLARRGSHANPVARNAPPRRTQLKGVAAFAAVGFCSIPLLFGLLIPGATLTAHALLTGDPALGQSFSDYIANTLYVAIIASLLTVLCALCLTYSNRLQRERKAIRLTISVATLGYAIPGLVLAVGFMGPLSSLDKMLASWLEASFDLHVGLLLTGSAGALILVYLARFLTVAFNTLDSGMARIHPNYDDAARSLGSNPRRVLSRIHLPLLAPSVLTALLLVFVDVVKELPATLVLRPFNFETLATRAYRLASDERLAEAALASILIVAVGLVPTLILAYQNFDLRANRLRVSS
ncbi:MAG: iron ABC transporter permease [Gammaproteobacteria bacterium]|nr:iron ABC transporter permease [Gammaproteobacteria bacterium]